MMAPLSSDPRVAVGSAPALPARWFWGILIGVTLFRFAFLWLSGLELSPDEAYYWDWSRQLDIGYYSKPPLVAWLIALSTGIFGDVFWAIRLPAVLAGLATLVGVYLAGKFLFGRAAGQVAALLLMLTPAHSAMSLLFTIDPPTLAFWSLALAVLVVAARQERFVFWLGGGALIGLAALGKQTALTMLAGVAGTVLVSPRSWPQWGRVVFGLGVPVVLAMVPVLLWNARHDWITFQHTGDHFGRDASGGIFEALGNFAGFAGSQVALATPVTFALVVVASFALARRWFEQDLAVRILLILGPAALAGVAVLSFLQEVQPNWPAPYYLAAFVLVGGWLTGTTVPFWRRMSFCWAAGVGLLLTSLFALAPFVFRLEGLAGHPKLDPTVRLREWSSLAAQVQEARDAVETDFVLAVTHRQPVSQLAFYLPDQPRVYRWTPSGVIDSQHEIWAGPDEYVGGNALVVVSDPRNVKKIAAHFATLEPLGEAVQALGESPKAKRDVYVLFLGRAFRGFASLEDA